MKPELQVGNRTIGRGQPCFIVAEVGSNHNRDLSIAKEMIRAAAKAGADAVKFQSQKLEEQYLPERETEQFVRFFRQTELPEEWYPELAAAARQQGVVFFSSPTYLRAVDLLVESQVPIFKIASPQAATYDPLIEQVARTGRPVILSTGMMDDERLAYAIQLCQKVGNDQIAILHCVSRYPTLPAEANLKVMVHYQNRFHCPVGFSDHAEEDHVPLAAVALGASIIEKHITLDRKQEGPDHAFAVEPKEFGQMVRRIREVEASLGNGTRPPLSADLKEFVEKIDMRLVAAKEIAAGIRITPDLLLHRRTGEGISTREFYRIVGRRTKVNIPERTPLGWDLIESMPGEDGLCE